MCSCACAQCDPQGQKSRVYTTTTTNNNSAASPEQRVNMDTMEMHYAIMTGFMHFSLAGGMGRKGEIKERVGEIQRMKRGGGRWRGPEMK